MPPSTAPDLRVFENSAAKSHAVYDGALAKIYEPYSNWTRSMLGNTPFAQEHFRYHTQKCFAEVLRQAPPEAGIAGQDFSDRRILLQHLAHYFVLLWGREYTVFDVSVSELLMRMRNSMDLIIREKCLALEDTGHPLRSHYKAKSFSTFDGPVLGFKMDDRDKALAQYIAGPYAHVHGDPQISAHTLELLRTVQPFLVERDDTYVERRLTEVRVKVRDLLKGYHFLTDELREKILQALMEDWQTTFLQKSQDALFDRIAEEVERETYTPTIFNQDNVTILQATFEHLLAQTPLTENAKQKLYERRPVFEDIAIRAYRENDRATLDVLHPLFGRYIKALDRPYGDFGHLGLVLAAYAQDVDMEMFRDRLLK